MSFRIKFSALLRRRTLEAEMQEEMRAHLELQTQLNLKAGMRPDDARHDALRRFGNAVIVQERCREQRRWLWLEQAMQDLSYAFRQLAKSPGFTVTVVMTMTLAIGACTVVFTAVNSTLLHPLAGQAADREVIIHETQPPQRPQMQLSPAMFADVERLATSFEYLAAWTGIAGTLQGDTEPFQVRGASISAGQLAAWSEAPALGRNFTAEELTRGDPVVMLGHALWQRAFGGSPDVINRVVEQDGVAYTIVGVFSPQFERYGSDIEFWVPLTLSERQRAEQRGARFLQVGAKLKRGVTLEQARAELDVIAANLAQQYPDTNKGVGLLVRDLGAYINRSLAPMLYILLGAVGCVLLIACANVANLLLARATSRRREISVRAALGAGRGRIMRQLLVESLLLAVLGGAGGILLAQWGLRFVRVYGPTAGTDLARLAYIEPDPAVLAFTVGFSLFTGVVFGLAPAWLGSRVDLNDALKQGGRSGGEGGLSSGLRGFLVVLEVSLAVVLLTGAGLLVRSFARLTHFDPGFAVGQLAVLQLDLNGRKYVQLPQRVQFADALLEKIRSLPGVTAAAVSTLSPFNHPNAMTFEVVGRSPGTVQPAAVANTVTPDYPGVMGMAVLRGRSLGAHDSVAGPAVVVINETLAREYFPNDNPLGHSLVFPIGPKPGLTAEIVGVVRDAMQGGPGVPPPAQFYLPWHRFNGGRLNVMVRVDGDPSVALPLLKTQVYAVDPLQPVAAVRTMEDLMNNAQARARLMRGVLGVYALIALMIAAVGIYGVMAYSVGQRTKEFGVRMALGASRSDVLRQVLRRGMTLVGLGLAVGLVGALFIGQVLQAILYETSPRDPLTLGAIASLLLAVSFVACLLPARRATKVDPMVALRAE